MDRMEQKPLRLRRNRRQIVELLEQFENAGVSVADFCKQHHISISNFHKWKSRYKSKPVAKNKTSVFTTLDILSSSSPASLFAEVKGIKIYQPVSASFLKDLLV
jgi:hypothetical protein